MHSLLIKTFKALKSIHRLSSIESHPKKLVVVVVVVVVVVFVVVLSQKPFIKSLVKIRSVIDEMLLLLLLLFIFLVVDSRNLPLKFG